MHILEMCSKKESGSLPWQTWYWTCSRALKQSSQRSLSKCC